ncbi:MAG: glycoside hydrolase family 172 protein [Lentimonas sp.]
MLLLLAAFSGAACVFAGSAKPITIESLLNEMVDHEAITRFPESNFRLKQESSYNRKSKTPDDAKGWFNNKDNNTSPEHDSFIRIDEVNSEKEWVLMDHKGAGTLVRTWMPFRNIGKPTTDIRIRIYVDGVSEPTLEGNMLGLFNGDELFPYPFAHKSLASAVNFFPIPYQKGLKVTTTDYPFFYMLTYREYPEGTAVKSFTVADYEAAAPLIAEVGEKLLKPVADDVADTVNFSPTLAQGESESIDLPKGSAAIRELSVKLANYDELSVTRTTVLKIEFDGMETVWCPIGDFFGSGIGLNPHQGWYRTVEDDGTMRCRWVMPYKGSAEVSLVNLGSAPVKAEVEVMTGAYQWQSSSMYFNAGWRGQYPVATRPYSDWNYITAKGRGVFVGDTLTVMNPVERWWGEGDEKIWIDGESFPSIFGTGTEDYYGYSWGGQSTDFYDHPFHAQPRAYVYNKLNRKVVKERNSQGYSVETRSRSLDTIPFGSSIQLDMEVWSWTDCDMGYGVGVYWYGFADTKSNRQPEPVEVLNVPPLPTAYFSDGSSDAQAGADPLKGAIELTSESVIAKSQSLGLKVHTRGPKGSWNQGDYLFAKSAVGDFIEFKLAARSPVAEKLYLNATKAPDLGILKLSVNGKAVSQSVDLYSKKIEATGFIELGAFDPVDGCYILRVEVVGKNSNSKGAFLTLDCIQSKAVQ